jgi:hypothetical protein
LQQEEKILFLESKEFALKTEPSVEGWFFCAPSVDRILIMNPETQTYNCTDLSSASVGLAKTNGEYDNL